MKVLPDGVSEERFAIGPRRRGSADPSAMEPSRWAVQNLVMYESKEVGALGSGGSRPRLPQKRVDPGSSPGPRFARCSSMGQSPLFTSQDHWGSVHMPR